MALYTNRFHLQRHNLQTNGTIAQELVANMEKASELLKVFTADQNPSSQQPQTDWPSQTKAHNEPLEMTINRPQNPEKLPLAPGKPVPKGYNDRIYRIVKDLATNEQDPTSQQLDDLFRMMEYDSPMGEMKNEAYTVWLEMRSRGIVPGQMGYTALLKVCDCPSWLR